MYKFRLQFSTPLGKTGKSLFLTFSVPFLVPTFLHTPFNSGHFVRKGPYRQVHSSCMGKGLPLSGVLKVGFETEIGNGLEKTRKWNHSWMSEPGGRKGGDVNPSDRNRVVNLCVRNVVERKRWNCSVRWKRDGQKTLSFVWEVFPRRLRWKGLCRILITEKIKMFIQNKYGVCTVVVFSFY